MVCTIGRCYPSQTSVDKHFFSTCFMDRWFELAFQKFWSGVPNQNGITWSVFCKPQSHKNIVTWPEILNRGLKPTVHEADWKKVLIHGRLRWIVVWYLQTNEGTIILSMYLLSFPCKTNMAKIQFNLGKVDHKNHSSQDIYSLYPNPRLEMSLQSVFQ